MSHCIYKYWCSKNDKNGVGYTPNHDSFALGEQGGEMGL